ncbi:GNAT family N-acetyltransferase [Amycolatopsis cynarae]|uniref:GNAT family N-acetyltransferase n=1 Tax=Amycolatopsis cynarae TaxID=2995223 RepID=A0ABY7AZ26_9PSEU|nr:GNAT family N-acyltransferase [Amycolatopsis sp. HUAS 11-8]WAL65280.1 GNAT family N-acetyltransferase [Amycolatopsis sp. HUAS 11-8]
MTVVTDIRYEARITTDPGLVRACQELRARVFSAEFGPTFVTGRDTDEFDEYCDHLAIIDGGEVVGTYRLLLPGRSPRLYSEAEFDLGGLAPLRPHLVEIGRSCVDPAHRSGAVINLMWSAMGRYALDAGYRHLAGCTSVSLADGGNAAAATWELVRARHAAPDGLSVVPRHPWIPRPRSPHRDGRGQVPPLLRAYLRIGAAVCGPPAHDPDFEVADFFTLLSFDRMHERYRRYFLGDAG